MKPKFRNVLEMALEEGVRFGWNRAHKHVEGTPHIDAAADAIVTEIFNSLDTWFDLEDNPEQVADGLKEAFREAVKQGIIPEVDKVSDVFMNKMVAELKPQNLTDLIYDWWEDIFTSHSDLDMEASIDDLVTRIEEWFPKEQSAAGSQNAYVECTVEGFNDCLTKIKGKLR